jgi:hypothetical protein
LTTLSIGILLSARTVDAHGHDMSKIVEGSYVSDEPLVRIASSEEACSSGDIGC